MLRSFGCKTRRLLRATPTVSLEHPPLRHAPWLYSQSHAPLFALLYMLTLGCQAF
jgi:hypothetical protein